VEYDDWLRTAAAGIVPVAVCGLFAVELVEAVVLEFAVVTVSAVVGTVVAAVIVAVAVAVTVAVVAVAVVAAVAAVVEEEF